MRVAYLINRYPAASHSFIRREIEAVEAQGIAIVRFSIRPADAQQLPDERDQAEMARTTSLLGMSAFALIASGLSRLVLAPTVSARGLKVAFSNFGWKPLELVRRTAYFLEAALLAKQIRNHQVQHIHAHFGTNSATVARIASILSGIPYSFTVHGPDEFDAPDGLDLSGKVKDCAFCVAISSYGRGQLMRWSAVEDWYKIEVVRCGVDSGFLDGEVLTEPPADPNLCSIARLSAQKGLPLLLEAATELRRRGCSFRLTLVGDGEMRSEVEALIASRGLEQFVILAGLADAKGVIGHLQKARAMVLPSFAEGLPVVIMEALALGRPVIVSSIAGTPELVTPECGWLVPAGSVDALVEAMANAIEAPLGQLSAMGRSGRERVLANHDAAKNGIELAALFIQAKHS